MPANRASLSSPTSIRPRTELRGLACLIALAALCSCAAMAPLALIPATPLMSIALSSRGDDTATSRQIAGEYTFTAF